MYFIVDAAGMVLSVNEFGAAQLGYRPDELVGRSVFEVFAEPERERCRENLRLCLERLGQSNAWEVQKKRKDGTALWVRENATAVQRASGEAIVIIVCEDVTERRRAEEAARESAKRFRALIEHAYDVVVLLNGDGGVVYASPSVERVFGYAPWELVGSSGLNLIHPDEIERATRQLVEARDHHGRVFSDELRIRHKHGIWLWTDSTVTNLLGEPSVRAFVVNLRDISAHKGAEEARRDSEQRFRDYAETASDWFWEN
jgi:PAS domain S-box-containing protein